MRTIILTTLLIILLAFPAIAVVELALDGEEPQTIKEVYLRDGVSFIAVDDVLPAVDIGGSWDAVEHVYRILTPRGTAVVSPGSHFLKLGERFIPLDKKPRFIDGRLRVSEEFVTRHLPDLIGQRIYYRNLDPQATTARGGGSALDRLFSFLLRKKKPVDAPVLRAVAIDPGHGGQDPGSLGEGGVKEKEVTLGVARSLQKLINMELGIPIYLSRDDDYGLSAEERLKPAQQPDVDVLLLLHAQAAPDYKPQGIHLYVRRTEALPGQAAQTDDTDSLKLAEHIFEALQNAGMKVYPIVEAPLLPLGQGDLPTVLIEMGYLSNPADRMMLQGEEGQIKLARALFSGLKKFGKGRK